MTIKYKSAKVGQGVMIHAAATEFVYGCLCGAGVDSPRRHSSWSYTDRPERVTCGPCLKILGRHPERYQRVDPPTREGQS